MSNRQHWGFQVSISLTFYTHLLRKYFCSKKFQSQNVTRVNLLSYNKICIKCWRNWLQVSISLTLYSRLFQTEVFCTAFMCLLLGIVNFWPKNIGTKASTKMFFKLTTQVLTISTSLAHRLVAWTCPYSSAKKNLWMTMIWKMKKAYLILYYFWLNCLSFVIID